METKTCRKCKKSHPLFEFYKHKRMTDGHLNICKGCTKRRIRKDYAANIKDPDWLQKERARCRERNQRLGYADKYRARTSEQKKRVRAYRQRWLEANPEKRRCHMIVGNMLRSGKLKKSSCEICGAKSRIDAHHFDYAKPLDVTWLCKKCHGKVHRKS